MGTERAFLVAIKEQPDDDDLRLIFADWLEDHDQPQRAELIRLQVELGRLRRWHPRLDELDPRRTELLAEHGQAWLGPWAEVGEIRRGLIHLRCKAARLPALLKAAGGETALAWVEGLTLEGTREEVEALLYAPWLVHLTSLDLYNNGLGPRGAGALAASPYLARITRLGLRENHIGPEGAAALAASPHLARLTSLDLSYNNIENRGAAALAASPHLANLTDLNLLYNKIGPQGAAALASSPRLAGLRLLDLRSNRIEAAGAKALASSPHLAQLTELQLYPGDIRDAAAEAKLKEHYGSRWSP